MNDRANLSYDTRWLNPWHLGHRGVFIPPIWHILITCMPCVAMGSRRFRTHILANNTAASLFFKKHTDKVCVIGVRNLKMGGMR